MPIISIANSPKATGGDIRTIHLSGTNYVMHVFEKSGFFTVPADIKRGKQTPIIVKIIMP